MTLLTLAPPAHAAREVCTEVANQKIVDTGASRLRRGVLVIVEAEFYRLP